MDAGLLWTAVGSLAGVLGVTPETFDTERAGEIIACDPAVPLGTVLDQNRVPAGELAVPRASLTGTCSCAGDRSGEAVSRCRSARTPGASAGGGAGSR